VKVGEKGDYMRTGFEEGEVDGSVSDGGVTATRDGIPIGG